MTEQLSRIAPGYTGAAPDLDKPFPTTSSLPLFYYQRPAYESAASALAKSLRSGRGLTIVTGEPGTGKTSFVANAIGHLGSQLRPVFLWYPHLNVEVMLSYVCDQLGLAGEQLPGSSEQKPGEDALRHHLFTLLQGGPSAVLVIDEAHAAQDDVLIEASRLTRTRSAQPQIATILVGLPQLEERLCSPPLAELIGDLPPRIRIKPFWQYEVRELMRLQLRAFGGVREDRFDAEAIARITAYSRGIPRLVKTLCNATLFTADLDALETITEDTVEDAVRLFAPPWAKEAMRLPDDAQPGSNAAPARAADDTAAAPKPLVAENITGKRGRVEEPFSKLWSRGTRLSDL